MDVHVDDASNYTFRTYLSAVPDSIIKRESIGREYNWQNLNKYMKLCLQIYSDQGELLYDEPVNQEYFKILSNEKNILTISTGYKIWEGNKYYNTIAKYKLSFDQ